jgi:hypothetical protein
MLRARHPLFAHLVGSGAVEVLLGGDLGFRFGGVKGRHPLGFGVGGSSCMPMAMLAMPIRWRNRFMPGFDAAQI